MIKAEDFKWLDRVYHLFHLGSYLCLSGALTDCFLPLLSSILDLYRDIFVRNNCFGELDSHDRRVSKQFVHTKYALNLHTNPITYIYYTFLLNGIKKDDY